MKPFINTKQLSLVTNRHYNQRGRGLANADASVNFSLLKEERAKICRRGERDLQFIKFMDVLYGWPLIIIEFLVKSDKKLYGGKMGSEGV